MFGWGWEWGVTRLVKVGFDAEYFLKIGNQLRVVQVSEHFVHFVEKKILKMEQMCIFFYIKD